MSTHAIDIAAMIAELLEEHGPGVGRDGPNAKPLEVIAPYDAARIEVWTYEGRCFDVTVIQRYPR